MWQHSQRTLLQYIQMCLPSLWSWNKIQKIFLHKIIPTVWFLVLCVCVSFEIVGFGTHLRITSSDPLKNFFNLGLIWCFLHLLGLKTITEQWNKSLAGESASQQKKHTCSSTKATQNVSHICCPSCAILMVTATSMFLHYRVIFSKPLTGDIWRGVKGWM